MITTTNSKDMYKKLYETASAITPQIRQSGVLCVGFHNWLNGYASALFIGEYEQCKSIMKKQTRYIQKMLGFVPQIEDETYVTFGLSSVNDTVLSLSMAILPKESVDRYYRLKRAHDPQTGPFIGIMDKDVGQTEIMDPVVPDTGALPPFKF